MADDKTKQDFRDRNRIAANEEYEVNHVAKQHGVSREVVLAAIEAVGTDRNKVNEYLSQRKK